MTDDLRELKERLARMENELATLRRSSAGLNVFPGLNRLGQSSHVQGDLTVDGRLIGGAHDHDAMHLQKIRLVHANGSLIVYPATRDGFKDALEASSTGSIILLPAGEIDIEKEGDFIPGEVIASGSCNAKWADGITIDGLTIGDLYAIEYVGEPWRWSYSGSTRYFDLNNGSGWYGGSQYSYSTSYDYPPLAVPWAAKIECIANCELSNHLKTWRVYFQATTTSIGFRAHDGNFADNIGSLSYNLRGVTTTGGIPSGVEVVGLGRNSILDGDLINNGTLTNLTVTGAIIGTGKLRMVYNGAGEQITDLVVPEHTHDDYAPVEHDHAQLHDPITLGAGNDPALTLIGQELTLTLPEGGGSITVEEVDGTPTVANVTKIKVSNGTLTDDGEGVVTITTGGGSGDLTNHLNDTDNPHGVTAEQVGLGNLTNDAQVKRSEMGMPNGVATLDSNGRVPAVQLPAIAITDVHIVATEAEQLALDAQEGDVCIRTDLGQAYIHNGGTAGTMADWTELASQSDPTIDWSGITGKPSTFPPSSHSHAGGDITSAVASANAAPWSGITGKPSTFPPSSHTHAGGDITSAVASANAAPWSGITGKPSTFPPSTHSHAGIYVPKIPPVSAHGPTPGLSTAQSFLITNYGVPSTASAVCVMIGGRWGTSSSSNFMNLCPYGDYTNFITGITNTQSNMFAVGFVPVVSTRFAVNVSGTMDISYVRILGYLT